MTPEPEDERQEKESREQRLNRLFGEALERDYRSIVYEPVPLFEEKPEAKPEIAAEPQKPERYSPEWHRQATQDFIDEGQKSYERRWGKSVWATGTPPAKMRLIGPTGGKISQQVHMINAKLGKGTSQQPLWMTGSQVKRYEEMGGHLSDLGYVVWRGPDDPRVPDIPELGPKGSGASTVWRYLKTLGNAFTRDYRMMPGGVPYQREGAMVPSLNNFRLWAEKGYAGFNYADMLATGMAEELATMFVDPFLKEMSFLPADLSKSAKLRDARRAEQMLEFQGTGLAAITMAAPHLEIAAGAAFAANQSIMLGRKAAERAVAAQNAEKLLKQLKRNPKTKRLNSHAKRKPIQKIEGTNDEILHLPDEPAGIQKTQRDVNPQSLPPTQEFDLAATQATLNDNWRKIANLPGIRRIYQKLSPVTLAKDPVAIADSTRRILRHEATQKHNWLLSPVRRLGSEQKVWGKRAENGLLAEGPLKGKSLNDIRTYPKRYWGKMTPLQRKWIEEMDKLEVRKKNYLLENDVNISLLEFDEGGRYAGRIVVAKVLDNGEIADYAFIVKKRTGVGGKKGFEQHREYTKAADAIKDGYRYLSEEESMYINMLGAYNKVIDQQMMDWFLTKIPWRSTRVPEAFNIAVKAAEFKISKSETLLDIIQQAKNDPAFKVAPVQLRALERIFPDEVASLRAAMKARTAPIDIPVPSTAAPVVSSTPTIGRSITEKFKEGLNAGSVFELGEVRPGIGYSWRSMGSNEYNRIIEGKSFGGPAQKGGFWSWFPKYSSNLTGTPQRPKYLVEVEIPSKMESLTRRGTINDVRAVWKSTKKGVWEPEPFAHTAAPPPTTAPARQTAANQAAARKAEIDELFDQASAKTVGSKALLDDDLKKANAVRARKKESLKLRDDESKMVNWPGIRGTRDKAIPKDVAESLKNTFEIKEGLTPSWLATPVNINAISRYFTLGGDASPFTIQWLFMPFNHPKAYAAAANAFARTLISTTHHSKMLDEASDVLSRAHNLEISGLAGTEWTEAFSVGGVMTRGRIRQVLSKPLDPFARAWNAGSDAAGIHMLRSLEPLIKTPQDRAAVEEFVNVFRGMFSSQRIGVSERTRIIESLALLAPRYTRAIFSILANTTRGGLRGELARKSLARGVTGVMSLGFSAELALQKINGATWEEALDAAKWRVTPWTKDGGRNPDFMLWRIAGQAVGPGSKLFSIMRLLADTAGGDAHRLIERSFENPLLRWAFFQTSPVVSKSVNFALGQNPMGEPTRDGFLSFAENTIAEGMIPIWVQSVLFEEGIGGESISEKINKRLIRGGAEFVGLRAFAEFPFFAYQAHAEAVTGKKYHEIQVH